jgi:TrpR-related protein YerC/YecD
VSVPAAVSAPEPDPAADLYAAFLALKTPEEVRDFLADLCTPAEVRAFAERWRVARLLDRGGLSYREIAEQAGASPTTVVRVARFLKEMPYRGYRRVLDRLAEKETDR